MNSSFGWRIPSGGKYQELQFSFSAHSPSKAGRGEGVPLSLAISVDTKVEHWFPQDCLYSPFALCFGDGRNRLKSFTNNIAVAFNLSFACEHSLAVPLFKKKKKCAFRFGHLLTLSKFTMFLMEWSLFMPGPSLSAAERDVRKRETLAQRDS